MLHRTRACRTTSMLIRFTARTRPADARRAPVQILPPFGGVRSLLDVCVLTSVERTCFVRRLSPFSSTHFFSTFRNHSRRRSISASRTTTIKHAPDQSKMIGFDETLPVTRWHDVYPAIDPSAHFRTQTFKDAVVLVTGASRGIGHEIALHYARAGARLALVARDQEGLDQTRAVISRERPDAQVLTFALDVRDGHKAEDAVNATVGRFGRIDVLVANAGVLTSWNKPLSLKCPDAWWNTFEVNTRGVFNFVRPSLPVLEKTEGYIVVISAEASHMRFPGASDYHISKHAINRLVEYIVLEHPTVKAFSVHPGVVKTELSDGTGWDISAYDTTRLSAASLLYLTSGRADWLSGRYVSVNWDLAEVERDWKAKIMDQHGLVSKLHIPQ